MDKLKSKMNVLVVVGFIFGYVLGAAVATPDPDPAEVLSADDSIEQEESDPEPTVEEEPEPEPEPEFERPTKDDFQLKLKKLDEACFGSAGCNTEVRVGLTNVTGIELDPTKTYELRYRITGANDPLLSTLEITGENYTVNEHYLDTDQGADLGAIIIGVSQF